MIEQTSTNTPPMTPFPRKASSRPSAYQDFVHRRCLLAILATVVILIIIGGIIVVAHFGYVRFGGQGWLKLRDLDGLWNPPDVSEIYLPSRTVMSKAEAFGLEKKSPGTVPFYPCGDQMNSCEAFSQPDICCPVEFACHRTKSTLDKIFCCNSSEPHSKCRSTKAHPAQCLHHYFECPTELGGGCCPTNTECYRTQCIPLIIAAIDSVIGTTTPTQTAAIVGAEVKYGEVAQSVMSKQPVFPGFILFYASFLLFCVAVWMGML